MVWSPVFDEVRCELCGTQRGSRLGDELCTLAVSATAMPRRDLPLDRRAEDHGPSAQIEPDRKMATPPSEP
jgi:hypothetical protein